MITEGHLVRHYQGRRGGRGPAIIDIAQDHLLYLLASEGFFDLGIALKGGTALRKFWAGNAGRSTSAMSLSCRASPRRGWRRPSQRSSPDIAGGVLRVISTTSRG